MTDMHLIDRLYATIQDRAAGDASQSYVARLSQAGTAKIAQKVGEEAVETALEAVKFDLSGRKPSGNGPFLAESADLIFHLLVLWADLGVKPDDVWHILKERQGMGGLAEKASRS